jgi:capsular exopolysaccharide synthesis family protein
VAGPQTFKRAEPAVPGFAPSSTSQSSNIVLLSEPDGAAAEAIRVLRTRIQSQHLQLGRRSLAICGPAPEVGCTFVAVNLAVALAQIGVKTLLVDGDLRQPSVHTYFDPPLTGGGLYACLKSGADSVADFADENVLPNLDVLSAGQPDSSAHELLAGDDFPEVINTCMRDYDLTIIDTPPANSCADGLRISTIAGFGLIVTRKNNTLVSDVRVLAEQLRKERARAIGTVLNTF